MNRREEVVTKLWDIIGVGVLTSDKINEIADAILEDEPTRAVVGNTSVYVDGVKICHCGQMLPTEKGSVRFSQEFLHYEDGHTWIYRTQTELKREMLG